MLLTAFQGLGFFSFASVIGSLLYPPATDTSRKKSKVDKVGNHPLWLQLGSDSDSEELPTPASSSSWLLVPPVSPGLPRLEHLVHPGWRSAVRTGSDLPHGSLASRLPREWGSPRPGSGRSPGGRGRRRQRHSQGRVKRKACKGHCWQWASPCAHGATRLRTGACEPVTRQGAARTKSCRMERESHRKHAETRKGHLGAEGACPSPGSPRGRRSHEAVQASAAPQSQNQASGTGGQDWLWESWGLKCVSG